MGIFGPAWKSRNWDRAVEAVEKLNDPTELAQAARLARCYGARSAAVRKLTDQAVLAEIAKTDKEGLVRKTVVWKQGMTAVLK